MSDQNARSGILARRRSRIIGFIVAEALAIGVLLLFGAFALLSSSRLTGSTLSMLVNIVTIVAAVAVAVMPIIFFAIAPVLPSGDR